MTFAFLGALLLLLLFLPWGRQAVRRRPGGVEQTLFTRSLHIFTYRYMLRQKRTVSSSSQTFSSSSFWVEGLLHLRRD